MFGKVYNQNVNSTNGADIFKALSALTIGRSENRGTLEVTQGSNGVYTLKCANHHFLNSRNKFVDNQVNARNLRELLTIAVGGELEKAINALPSQIRLNKTTKLSEIKEAFQKAIIGTGDQTLTRKDICAILENVNAFKKNLCVDSLLLMKPRELATLADNGGDNSKCKAAKSYKERTESIKDAYQNLLYRFDMSTSAGLIFKSCSSMVKSLYNNVKAQTTGDNRRPDSDSVFGRLNGIRDALKRLKEGKGFCNSSPVGSAKQYINFLLKEAKNGYVIGFDNERQQEFETCLTEIEKIMTEVDKYEKNNKKNIKYNGGCPEFDGLVDKLITMFEAYINELDKDLPGAYNKLLKHCGINNVYIDKNGSPALRTSGNSGAYVQKNAVQRDFETLFSYLANNVMNPNAAALGVRQDAFDVAGVLNAYSEALIPNDAKSMGAARRI